MHVIMMFHKQERRQSVKPCAEGTISGCQARTCGQQGISESFGGVMPSQLPGQSRYSLPFQAYQFEGSVDQFGVLQVGSVGQTDLTP